MATQSPKRRSTKTTKKTTAAKATSKKTVKRSAVPKTTAKKPGAAAAATKAPRQSLFKSFRSRRAAKANAKPARTAKAVSLHAWNKWLTLLFVVQGLVILLLSKSDVAVSVFGHYLAQDSFASQSHDVVRVTAMQHLFDVNVAYWLAGISFIFALGHLLGATALRKRYDTQITAGASKLRWITYIFGYGALTVLFALLAGVSDVTALALLVVLTIVYSVLALGAEQAGRVRSGFARGVALTSFLVVWAVLAYYLLNALLYDGSIPTYVYALLGVSFLLSLQLGRIFASQQKAVGKWANYVYAERAYMIWTVVLVVAATWQIFVGTLEP